MTLPGGLPSKVGVSGNGLPPPQSLREVEIDGAMPPCALADK